MPDGYLDDVLKAGAVVGDLIDISPDAYHALRSKYSPGLGDTFSRFTQPIARTIDGLLGTDLEHCPGCAERRAWLNEHFPNKAA